MMHETLKKHARGFQAGTNPANYTKKGGTTWMLTRFEVHHLSDKPVVCDSELGELQFIQAVDVSLAL